MVWRSRPEVMAWWTLAASDLRMARVAAALEPPEWRMVCFHAQQAGEKALKAVLECRDRPVPRTHDLALCLQMVAGDIAADDLLEACARLTLHGVGPRYPGPMGEATAVEAGEALDDAARVVDWALGQLDRVDA